jgi:tetratricopeptide (TPR) repeat protein
MKMPTRIIFISAMPKDHAYLDQVNDEINSIRDDIFEGINIEQHDYITQVIQYINEDRITDIFAFEPDIIHFTGHGTNHGLVLQYGDPISAKQLKDLFVDQKEIQLLFLNACYSADQISELVHLKNIKYIIGNEGEVSEYSATDFASIFYKHYKRAKNNIPQAYVDAIGEYNFKNPSEENIKRVFYPNAEIVKLTSLEQPIEKAERVNQIKVIQSMKIPNDLLNKIQDTIKAFDEDIMISQDPLRFKDEMKNVSGILSTLKVHALEYGLDIDRQKLKDQNREVPEVIKKLDDPRIPQSRQEVVKYMENTYQQIIINIFKKIHFNLVKDSIEKLPPLLPEDTDYEFFGSVIGIMYSMLKSLNHLRAKINQSFEADYKFHEDYLMYRCFDLITHINLEFKDLTELLISEVNVDIYRINFHDCLNLINQLDNFRKQLRKTQDQKAKSSRITDLKECLENVSNIEEGLMYLFRAIVLIGLERKSKISHSSIVYNLSKDDNSLDTEIDTRRFYKKINTIGKYADLVEPPELLSTITELTAKIVKEYVEYVKDSINKSQNSHSTIVYNLFKDGNALNTEIDTSRSYEEIETLENELMENTNLVEPRELLSTITNLNAKIVKEYVDYSMNVYYSDKDIHSCYEHMYRTLVIVRNDISGNLEKNLEKFDKYPYLYPEIAELCNFWKFRLDALERKQARKYLARINYYFANHMYKKVSEASDMKGDKDNIKLLNIKFLNKIGVAKMQLGEYHEAIDKFNKILELDKLNINALFNLGLTYQEVEGKDTDKKFTKSIQQFEKVLEKDPYHVNALTSLGVLFFKIGKYSDASKLITDAIRVSEHDDWRAFLAMGCILSDGQQEYSSAKSYFDRCSELNPTSTQVNLNKSQNLILLKSYAEAETLLKSILDKMATVEDRSTKIITIIMLICLRYLNKDESNSDNERLIVDLLRLLDLKDTSLVDWNFHNLQSTVDKSQDLKNGDKEFLKNLLSIPGNKPTYESKALKKKIQDFVVKNDLGSRNVHYIPDDGEKIKVEVKIIDEIGKSEWNEIKWVVWNISLNPSSEFIKDGQVKYVTYTFDPSFQDKRVDKKIYPKDDNGKFSINVMGWDGEERKFEIELHRNDDSILKMTSILKAREQQ